MAAHVFNSKLSISSVSRFEPRHEKTCFLQIQKQERRSAAR